MERIYIFSGLGADEKAFQKLDFSGFNTTFIQWARPVAKESIEQYARRLLDQISTERPILLGLSFGGMVAVEVAKMMETEKIILIASGQTQPEISFYYRWMGVCGWHRLLPVCLLKHPCLIANWFFGTESKEDRKMLTHILHCTDNAFIVWVIDQIAHWRNQVRHSNLRHIAGTNDRILPCRLQEIRFSG